MARLLIIASDHSGRRGEVVAVKPDGHVWGAKEVPPRFEHIDLPGVDPRRLQDMLAPDLDAENDDAFVARRLLKVADITAAKVALTESRVRDHISAYR